MVVYKATNKTNGKCYIGITTQTFAQRKSEHVRRFVRGDRDHKFYLALKKYGLEEFAWEVLEECESSDQLVEREQHYIEHFNSYNRGYNCNPGGTIISQETRDKISEALTGRDFHWGWKVKASRIANGSYGGDYGIKGAKNARAKSYVVTDSDGVEVVVTGLRQFCRDNGLTNSNMLAVAAGRQGSHKGYKCCRLEGPSTTRPEGRTPKRVEMGDISLR